MSTFVSTHKEISTKAFNIHKISKLDLIKAPSFSQMWKDFLVWSMNLANPKKKVFLIAHFGHLVDIPVLQRQLLENKLILPPNFKLIDSTQNFHKNYLYNRGLKYLNKMISKD